MGKGRGGYTEIQPYFIDSGRKKVIDPGAIFVAKQYIKQGYEAVFRQVHPQDKHTFDLTIKISDDKYFVKNIEVKKVTSPKPSQIATNIERANRQIDEGDTIALYFPDRVGDEDSVNHVKEGLAEAKRKGWIKGLIEVWFKDKKCVVFQLEGE